MKNTALKWRLLSFVAGFFIPFCFSPFDKLTHFSAYLLFPLIAVFFLQIRYANSVKNALLQSSLFGFGIFLSGISWLYVAIHEFGSTPWWLAAIFTLLFITIMALFFSLQGGLSYLLMNKLIKKYQSSQHLHTTKNIHSIDWVFYLLLFPLLGILFEWLRSWILTGLPWLLMGYSQISTPLAGYAPIFGVYGLSLISMIIAGGLALLVHKKQRLGLIVGISVLFLIGFILQQQQWTKASGRALKVSLVQANINQQSRWNRNFLQSIKQKYYHLSENLWQSTDLLVWPENAIPIFYQYEEQSFFKKITAQVIKNDISFITGVPYLKQQKLAQQKSSEKTHIKRVYYNSLLKIEKDAKQFYFKRHLVPFGEYLPLEHWLRGLIEFFNIPMSGFSLPEKKQKMMTIKGIPVAITLCYEDIFPELLLNQLPKAQFLINLSNNGWYGDSLAPHQHLQIAQMRALETGRELIRSTTSGISALIDAKGQLKKHSKQFESAILSGKIQPRTGSTPFVRYENTALLIYAVLISFLFLLFYFKPIIFFKSSQQ